MVCVVVTSWSIQVSTAAGHQDPLLRRKIALCPGVVARIRLRRGLVWLRLLTGYAGVDAPWASAWAPA
jgi:hypothetical protein